MECPFLSLVGLLKIECETFDRFDTKTFNSTDECQKYTNSICFNKFYECERYLKYYSNLEADHDKKCIFCCNTSWYSGLPKGYDGQEWCYCQEWQKPMKHNDLCEWYNRHPDWPLETTKKKESVSMIQLIPIEKLCPHPDNPRKDLGDLAELAESIKSQGILQNLTVVPWFSTITDVGADNPKDQEKMGYYVVIGHRRLAAAKLAGLTEVPCAIAEMTHQEQVSTMLLENMQRVDLTVYEQAQGFQMLLDFGESINNIAEKTGFSETTIRHRVKLLELDQEKLKESVNCGGTLQDYIKLEKIKDVRLRNKVLKEIGTSNFEWALKNAVTEEYWKEFKAALISELNKWATPIKDSNKPSGAEYVEGWYEHNGECNKIEKVKKPNDTDTVKYFYQADRTNVSLYRKAPKVQKEKTPAKINFEKRTTEIKALTKRAYELRYQFIKNFTATKKYLNEIIKFAAIAAMKGCYRDYDDLFKLLDVESPIDSKDDWETQEKKKIAFMKKRLQEDPVRMLLLAAYLSLYDKEDKGYHCITAWQSKCTHYENRDLNILYDALISLGYEMSDEEKALRDGTHELFDVIDNEAEE